ncbi:MAG: transcriptional regulator [Alphaproteobacteria bacterium]|nr:transcriptional regulator [Alphaproteobacteria bacterium]
MDIKAIEDNAEDLVNLLKALANDKRLLIMCSLLRGEKCVGELEDLVDLSQSALSQHLARLRRDRLVSTRRDAQTIYYSLQDEKIHLVMKALCSIIKDD